MTRRRSVEIDAVRAAALFGICIVNIPFMALPSETLFGPKPPGPDLWVGAAVELLFMGKFFPLFSFVFGWGFAVQMRAAARVGASPAGRHMRRLAGLLALGVAHAALVFNGDILVLYAMAGLLLWLLRDLSPRALMRVATGLLVAQAMALAALIFVISNPAAVPPGVGYLGGFGDAVERRMAEWPGAFLVVVLFNGPAALAAFAAGLAAAKVNFLEPGSPAYARLRRAVPLLLASGLVLSAGATAAMNGWLGETLVAILAYAALAVGAPCLSVAYLVAVVEAARRWRPGPWAVAAGRMSLTAYVAQGVLAGLVLYGYGAGLYGGLGHAMLFVLATAIFLVVHAGCALWQHALGQGPLERVLRAATYAGRR